MANNRKERKEKGGSGYIKDASFMFSFAKWLIKTYV